MTDNDTSVPVGILQQMHQINLGVATGGFDELVVRAQLQAIIEKKPFEKSSLSNKVIRECEGVRLTEAFLAQRMNYRGWDLKRHRNGGGWVPLDQDEYDTARPFVAETAYVGPFAMVYNCARVLHKVKIKDHARVHGNAWLNDDAIVAEYADVGGAAYLGDRAHISYVARIGGNVQFRGSARAVEGKFTSGIYHQGLATATS